MVDIVINIPNDKVNELKLGFLKAYPIPRDHGVPKYTELEWATIWIKEQIFNAYREGKCMIASELTVPIIDGGVIV